MSGSMHLDVAKGLSWLLPMMKTKLGSLFNILTFKYQSPNIAIIQAYAIPLHIQLLVACLKGHEMIHDDACSETLHAAPSAASRLLRPPPSQVGQLRADRSLA